jgi:ABC-type transport system involved in multi-copper enzyme maturation permease subunit
MTHSDLAIPTRIPLLRGVGLVARHEFQIRIRTGRWQILLAVWLVVLVLFIWLVDAVLVLNQNPVFEGVRLQGVALFGSMMLFVLFVMQLISPALTSQTINGDRERGTLATLQATLLTPTQIAVGKLLAGWGVGLVALALTAPFTVYAFTQGGLTVWRVVGVYTMVAVLVGVVCAVSQAWSALVARGITSALLSYLTVGFLNVGTLLLFGLVGAQITDTVQTTQSDGYTYTDQTARPDKVWWIIAPNPFVVVADAAPRVPPILSQNNGEIMVENYDPLSALAQSVRQIRQTPYNQVVYVDGVPQTVPTPPLWPFGLGFDLALGLGSVVVTIRRLRAPSGRLAKGVRVA